MAAGNVSREIHSTTGPFSKRLVLWLSLTALFIRTWMQAGKRRASTTWISANMRISLPTTARLLVDWHTPVLVIIWFSRGLFGSQIRRKSSPLSAPVTDTSHTESFLNTHAHAPTHAHLFFKMKSNLGEANRHAFGGVLLEPGARVPQERR